MQDLANLTPENPLLLHGDCLELMKTLPDKSVDILVCDMPYGETALAWDTPIDLAEFWRQFKRLRKSKRTACIHFCSTAFGYSLIKSWEKGFKMDMVWKKRNKTGGLQSRYRPMRNHEMVYFFYEQAPLYNRDKYHKRIRSVSLSMSEHYDGLAERDTGWHSKDLGANASFDPKQPGSVLEEGETEAKGNENPASVLEQAEYWADQPSDSKTGHGWDKTHMNTPRLPSFEPGLPPSVLEDNSLDVYDWIENPEIAPFSVYEGKKCFVGKRDHQTQKPLDILEFFLKYWTNEGDTVLDPTMGSGSTGVACKKMGRKFIGVELTDKYYQVACKRVREAVAEAEAGAEAGEAPQ